MPLIDLSLWVLTTGLASFALSRLVVSGLWRRPPYSALAIMLGFTVVRDLLLFQIPFVSHSYTVAWAATLPPLLLCHAYAAFSTYRAIAQLYPRIGRFAMWLVTSALFAAAVLCCATLFWEVRRIGGSELPLRAMFLLNRWADGLASGALLLACAFLRRFPRPLKQLPANLVRHTALLAAYFSASSLVFFAQNLTALDGVIAQVQRGHFILVGLLYAGWAIGLKAAGESFQAWEPLSPEVSKTIENRAAFAAELARQAAK